MSIMKEKKRRRRRMLAALWWSRVCVWQGRGLHTTFKCNSAVYSSCPCVTNSTSASTSHGNTTHSQPHLALPLPRAQARTFCATATLLCKHHFSPRRCPPRRPRPRRLMASAPPRIATPTAAPAAAPAPASLALSSTLGWGRRWRPRRTRPPPLRPPHRSSPGSSRINRHGTWRPLRQGM